ncbi:MAG TPA: hypothetical protein VE863_19655 [Pyrinomonadaceae bacterium]|jgi:phosphoribosylaminoimidazolecarboxamide formyltransferase/IMP cyclohydrolase|nr:hypothetical protein [Pyrinomonadaceae bacterium]
MAARMASNPKTKGAVSVDPKTKKDAVSARKGVRSLFGPLREGKVKRTVFQYHEIVNSQYVQKIDKPAKLQLRKRKTRLADVVLFDIEKYSEQPQPKQAKLADSLSRCVEFALADLGAKPCYGPAGDGGYLAFLADESEGSNIAFSFARNLRDQAKDEEVPIRIGIASGPIASSDDRPILGGVVLEADSVSSHASPGEIAVTRDFWEHQPVQLRYGWDTKSEIADHSIFLIHQPEIIAQAVTEIDNVLSDAPPIYVRTVLISMQKKERLEIPLTYFRERGIKTIATPNTAQYIRSLGFDCVTTFDYTKSPPLLTARGSLHPYILMAIAASAADEEKITSLRALGLGSIDLVFVNTSDPIISEDMTRRELMEQIAAVQIGGPSLVRWTLKQWMTAAAVVSPDDYGLLVNDLKRNNDRLSSEMRLVLLRQAMGYLARKDLKTSRLFGLLWSRV